MADTIRKPATYQDILDLPPGVVGELIKGALYAQPRPRLKHAAAQSSLIYEVTGPFNRGIGGPGGWVFFSEPELHFGDDVLVPDVAGWRVERLPDVANDAFATIAPDWLCEILSPSTAQLDRALKAEIYATQGAMWMWLVDPAAKTLEAYRNQSGKWLQLAVFKEGEDVKAEPFDAAPFKLDVLWI
jgi:Uma2 family endonuclease